MKKLRSKRRSSRQIEVLINRLISKSIRKKGHFYDDKRLQIAKKAWIEAIDREIRGI